MPSGRNRAELQPRPSLAVIAREWGRIGCIGFGGPPAHITLLRTLCVSRRGWLTDAEFERAIAATNLLPGPASTQLAIYCAWRLRGNRGALLGGLCFIVPGLVLILALAALFLSAPGGGRRDHRRERATRGGDRRALAVRGAGRRGRVAAAAPRRRGDAPAGRMRRYRRDAARRADTALSAHSNFTIVSHDHCRLVTKSRCLRGKCAMDGQ